MADNVLVDNGTGTDYTTATDEVAVNGGSVAHVQFMKLVDGTSNGTAGIPGDATNGLDVDVTRLPALATGSNVIGALTANQSVNVAQMNGVTITMGNGVAGTGVQRMTLASDSTGNIATIGTSVTPGTSAAHLGKAEDAVAGSGDTGVFALAVQRAAPASNAATGDYVEFQMSPANGLFVAPAPITSRITATPTIATSGYVANDVMSSLITFSNAALASGRAGQIVNAVISSRTIVANALELWIFQATTTIASADSAAFDLTDANLETGQLCGVIDFSATGWKSSASNSVCTGTSQGGAVNIPYVASGSANLFGSLIMRTAAGQYAGTTDLVIALTVTQF